MSNKIHVYAWDDEPIDERPSEFQSTGFSGLSGYHPVMGPARRSRPTARFGTVKLLATSLLLMSAIGWAGFRVMAWIYN